MSRSGPPDTTRPDPVPPVVTFTPHDPPRTCDLLVDGASILLGEALPALHARDDVWGAVTALALDVVARGAITATVSPGGYDAWAADLDDADDDRLRRLDEAAGIRPDHLRAFCDAVADTLPRSDDGHGPYAGAEPVLLERARTRAPGGQAEPAATDAVRLSLRIESADPAASTTRPMMRAVVQVHASCRVTDAAALWDVDAPGLTPRHRVATALALRRAAQLWPPLERLLRVAVPDALDLDDTDLADLLASGVAALASCGVAVHWPRGIRENLRPRIVAGRDDGGSRAGLLASVRPGHGAGSVALDWQLALRGDPLTVEECEMLASAASPLVRLRDEWVLIDPALARRAARSAEPEQVPAVRAVAAALAGELVVDGVAVPVTAHGGLARLRDLLATAPATLPEPPGLTAELRTYQRQGLGWLARMAESGLGGCLADDMGSARRSP